MTDKNEPKIRMVTLDKQLLTNKIRSEETIKYGGKACPCDCDQTSVPECPDCLVMINCGCEGGPEACSCESDSQDRSGLTIRGKDYPRTLFKIAKNNK